MLVLAGSSQAPLLVTSKLFLRFVSQPTYKNTEAVYWSEGLFRVAVVHLPPFRVLVLFVFFGGFALLFSFWSFWGLLFSTSLHKPKGSGAKSLPKSEIQYPASYFLDRFWIGIKLNISHYSRHIKKPRLA